MDVNELKPIIVELKDIKKKEAELSSNLLSVVQKCIDRFNWYGYPEDSYLNMVDAFYIEYEADVPQQLRHYIDQLFQNEIRLVKKKQNNFDINDRYDISIPSEMIDDEYEFEEGDGDGDEIGDLHILSLQRNGELFISHYQTNLRFIYLDDQPRYLFAFIPLEEYINSKTCNWFKSLLYRIGIEKILNIFTQMQMRVHLKVIAENDQFIEDLQFKIKEIQKTIHDLELMKTEPLPDFRFICNEYIDLEADLQQKRKKMDIKLKGVDPDILNLINNV